MERFSSLVKQHICEKTYEELGIGEKERVKWKDCCNLAFLRSVFLFLAIERDGKTVLSSDRQDLLEITAYLLIRVFDLEAQVEKRMTGNRKGAVLVLPTGTRQRILQETRNVLDGACHRCPVLVIRGAFLSCGTVLDPEKGYHAAFTVKGQKPTEELISVLASLGVEAKVRTTEKGNLVYLKESGKIEDLLSIVGAELYSLELMNRKIERSIRGDINRRQNFDDANLKKTVNGAQSIISAIHFLEEAGVLETLSEPLQSAAKLRMSYPEVSLKELCQRSEEELTKSGLNHRLQKLVTLAETIRKEEENNEK